MFIKTKLSIALGIAIGIAALTATVLFVAFERVHKDIAQIQDTDRIVRSVFELKIVTVDHQALALNRTLAQWEAKHTTLLEQLDDLPLYSPEERFLVERMKHNHTSLKNTFDALRDLPEQRSSPQREPASTPMTRRLTAKIDVSLLSMIADANQLLELIYEELVDEQRYATMIVGGSTLVMVALILGLALMVRRTAIGPLLSLGRSAAIVGEGDLQHRTGMDTSDEVGQLSHAFDAMLDRLNNVMASRDALNREVAQRKEAEDKLHKTLANLERSNKDLEQFAYSASHDLQEPLRKVMSFGSLLTSEYGDQLEGDAALYVQTMQNAIQRMQTLINDLLTYSRVTTRGKEFVTTDLGKVVQGVLSDLETRIEETGATVDVADLPTFEADPTQMRQIFQNLIGNALKFHRPDQAPYVKVYAREPAPKTIPPGQDRDSVIQCVVEDNGIGFEEKFAERIFGVFQRLHGRKEFSGSGIGLAVCRRIAERHGGTIQAESTPDQGARFVITLPRNPVHEQEEENP